jgi:hypothetical protein
MPMDKEVQAWIGIDWADAKHDLSLYDVATGRQERLEVQQSPEALAEWIGQLRLRYGNRGEVAVVLEQGKGPLLNVLMGCEFLVLYIINPKSLSRYREAFYGSGAKSDPVDAELMRDMVRQNPERFRAWRPDDVPTRSLRLMTEGRRNLVNQATRRPCGGLVLWIRFGHAISSINGPHCRRCSTAAAGRFCVSTKSIRAPAWIWINRSSSSNRRCRSPAMKPFWNTAA